MVNSKRKNPNKLQRRDGKKITFNAYYQNVRGLKTKLYDWRTNLVTTMNINLIAITETNLDKSVEDSEIIAGDWSVARRDRGRAGGGVMLLAKAPLTLLRLPEYESQEIHTHKLKRQYYIQITNTNTDHWQKVDSVMADDTLYTLVSYRT
ncbi:unnamed protein product [Colias eurytheme]|nr:unnamed protein product [Colias eurytheme]